MSRTPTPAWEPGDPIHHRPDPHIGEGFARRIFDVIDDHSDGCSTCRLGVTSADAMVMTFPEPG